jgi:hypothetical protein
MPIAGPEGFNPNARSTHSSIPGERRIVVSEIPELEMTDSSIEQGDIPPEILDAAEEHRHQTID